jgi:hypothetical protein
MWQMIDLVLMLDIVAVDDLFVLAVDRLEPWKTAVCLRLMLAQMFHESSPALCHARDTLKSTALLRSIL